MDGTGPDAMRDELDPQRLPERLGGVPSLDRDLEALFAVDPSPAYVARIRARIADEQPRRAWLGWPYVMGATCALAVLVLAVWMTRTATDSPAGTPPAERRLAEAPLQPVASEPVAEREAVAPPTPQAGVLVRVVPPAPNGLRLRPAAPLVMIDAAAAAAFHRFALSIESGTLDVAVPLDPAPEAGEPEEITILPVVIDPLVVATRLEEGDLQ